MLLAKLTSRWSHARGERQLADGVSYGWMKAAGWSPPCSDPLAQGRVAQPTVPRLHDHMASAAFVQSVASCSRRQVGRGRGDVFGVGVVRLPSWTPRNHLGPVESVEMAHVLDDGRVVAHPVANGVGLAGRCVVYDGGESGRGRARGDGAPAFGVRPVDDVPDGVEELGRPGSRTGGSRRAPRSRWASRGTVPCPWLPGDRGPAAPRAGRRPVPTTPGAQSEPWMVAAASVICWRKAGKPPKVLSSRSARGPRGAPPPSGLRLVPQQRVQHVARDVERELPRAWKWSRSRPSRGYRTACRAQVSAPFT
jgi:hypothetical protein